MDRSRRYEILTKLSLGSISVDEAIDLLEEGGTVTAAGDPPDISAVPREKKTSYEDIGFAKLDLTRAARQGAPEVVYCEGKTKEQLLSIYMRLAEKNGEVLGTRATAAQAAYLQKSLPGLSFNRVSRIMKIEKEGKSLTGCIAVCSAGTADIPVAEEASETAEFLGSYVERFYDIGVCGLSRLIENIGSIRRANCIIAVAGMEGALASVIGGLVYRPVIAVPTSVGYGAHLGGVSALLTMINSCANSVSVVNIDNGFGAGFIAHEINRLAAEK